MFGVVTILRYSQVLEDEPISSFHEYIMRKAEEHLGEKFENFAQCFWKNVGLLINERYVNLPP